MGGKPIKDTVPPMTAAEIDALVILLLAVPTDSGPHLDKVYSAIVRLCQQTCTVNGTSLFSRADAIEQAARFHRRRFQHDRNVERWATVLIDCMRRRREVSEGELRYMPPEFSTEPKTSGDRLRPFLDVMRDASSFLRALLTGVGVLLLMAIVVTLLVLGSLGLSSGDHLRYCQATKDDAGVEALRMAYINCWVMLSIGMFAVVAVLSICLCLIRHRLGAPRLSPSPDSAATVTTVDLP